MTAIKNLVKYFAIPLDPDVEGFYYLASPYTSKDREKTAAWVEQMQDLMPKIVDAYPKMTPLSPVLCTDPLADVCDPEGGWYAYALRFLKQAEGFIIITLDGWEESLGIMVELGYARGKELPISMLDPKSIPSFPPCDLGPIIEDENTEDSEAAHGLAESDILAQMERLRQMDVGYENWTPEALRAKAIEIIEDDIPF